MDRSQMGAPITAVWRCACGKCAPCLQGKSAQRKGMPLFSGALMYFPDALLAVAEFSRINNEKHNPGEDLHWSKHKSNDHADCAGRHLVDIGPDWDAIDPENQALHAQALAWRSLALLQIVIEAKRAGLKPREYLKRLKEKAASAVR